MKRIVLIFLLVSIGQLAFAQHEVHQMTASNMQAVYTCPMHPEVKRPGPGTCPKCGMKLVAQKSKSPQPKSTAPAKKAPVKKPVNTGAVKKTPQPKILNKPVQTVSYTCPMHPEIHSAHPGKCPVCGMNLVKETVPKASPEKPAEMHIPVKDNAEKAEDKQEKEMAEMEMDGDDATLANIKKAKANLGPIRTVSSKIPPRTVRYDLYIADTLVNFSGKSKRAIAVNGQIPMPTLTFTQGDTAEIHVHNKLKEKTSLHWHGLFLPNKEDGVPYLTQMPIEPGATYIYRFPIIQHGTHWYHSHSGLQEQIGMYGAFIMNKRQEWDIPTLPVVISEWTDMDPHEVDRSLHMATDWFAIQKGATQSYSEAIKTGNFTVKVNNEWKRMSAMDVSDVYYDAFLINGKNQNEQRDYKAGDKVRLRIANAGASDYFWLKYAGGKITVVATDGNDVEPVEVDRLIIAVSETYDVVVTIPENKSYEFLVTPEDRTKSASLWLGKGKKVPAGAMPKLKYFAGMKMMNEMMDMKGNMVEMEGMRMQNQIMDMNTVMYPEITGEENAKETPAEEKGMDSMQNKSDMKGHQMDGMEKMHKDSMAGMKHQHMDAMSSDSMQGMDMAADIVTLNYNMLRDPKKTTLPDGPWKELRFDLTGNMSRYVWTLDNKTVSESDKILIKKGENVRIILFNNSMMRHPMHLHGHDFRVVNDQGENAPMKNIIDIMPMERDTLEFAATESGDWFFHCHILYHMMSGMGRVLSYENSPPNPEIPDPKLAQRKLFRDDRMFHTMAQVGLESNGSDGEFMVANTRFRLTSEWRLGMNAEHGAESETYFGRYIGRMQWLFPFVGFDYHYNNTRNESEKNLFGQLSNQTNRKAFVAGIQYTLPMLMVAEARVDSKGKLRFQLMREDIPLTPRLRMNLMGNTDKEYMAGLRYIVTKYFGISTHYDNDMGYGLGVTLTY